MISLAANTVRPTIAVGLPARDIPIHYENGHEPPSAQLYCKHVQQDTPHEAVVCVPSLFDQDPPSSCAVSLKKELNGVCHAM